MLTGPPVLIDALPYIDQEYNDPEMKKQVDALIAAELKTFKPQRDYLEKFPEYEPTFKVHFFPVHKMIFGRCSCGSPFFATF